MAEEVYHVPALLRQTVDALNVEPGGVYVDATYGGGGHSRELLGRLSDGGHLYSFDQDKDAVERATSDPRLTVVYGNFRFLSNFLRYYGVDAVDGIMADLGVSFHHFDDSSRGFTFRTDAPLDMRMNQKAPLTAADVLERYSEEQIADTLYLYGELKRSRQIASAIVKARQSGPVATVRQLTEVSKPYLNPQRDKKELACLFQALRIEVNGELDALRSFLTQAAAVLRPGGRLAVLTYHSLEDRLVKNFIKTGNFEGRADKDFFGRTSAPLRQVNSKPIVADEAETAANPRSRSAKLRIAEKL